MFAPRKLVKLIGLASRIVFFEEFKAAMSLAADRASKTAGKITSEMFAKASEAGLCSPDVAEVYVENKPRLAFVSVADLEARIGDGILTADPTLCHRLATDLMTARSGGFSASTYQALLDFIEHAFKIAQAVSKTGDFKDESYSDEKSIQKRILQYFNDNRVDVVEGGEVAGGETDIVLGRLFVIENKHHKVATKEPHKIAEKYAWQARRYAIPIAQSVAGEIIAYQPSSEDAIVALHNCVSIRRIRGGNEFVSIRLVLPWNYGNPSSAMAPPVTK